MQLRSQYIIEGCTLIALGKDKLGKVDLLWQFSDLTPSSPRCRCRGLQTWQLRIVHIVCSSASARGLGHNVIRGPRSKGEGLIRLSRGRLRIRWIDQAAQLQGTASSQGRIL
jgi:hypothetical protein